MTKILSPGEFAKQVKEAGAGLPVQAFRDASGNVAAKLVGISAQVASIGEDDRSVDFVISTGALDRYNSTIAPKGWMLDNFNANPVVLWAHDDSIPAIGRAENTRVDGNRVRSRAIFATREIHPLADTVYGLIKNKFINAASVGWIPLKWQFVEEEGRGFGVDYLEQELLEWSAVNIPANHECLAEARSIGIDTKPLLAWAERALDQGGMLMIPRTELEAMRKAAGSATVSPPARRSDADWKCGAARDLPIEDDDGWDGPAAEKAIFSECGFDGDSPDSAKARKAFLCYDAAAPDKRGSYKLPFAKMVDGKLKASASGIRAAASRLPQTDIPEGVKDEAHKVLDAYEAKIGGDEDKAFAAFEQNLAALNTLAANGAITRREFGDRVVALSREIVSDIRAGRVLSGENEDRLHKAHEHIAAAKECMDAAVEHSRHAMDHVSSVVEQNRDPEDGDDDQNDPEHDTGDDNDDDSDDNNDRSAHELRHRRVRLLKLSASPIAIAAGTKH